MWAWIDFLVQSFVWISVSVGGKFVLGSWPDSLSSVLVSKHFFVCDRRAVTSLEDGAEWGGKKRKVKHPSS